MSIFFETRNSIYELDPDQHRIRRVSGVNDPTLRQGDDGEWQTYLTISEVVVGSIVVIVWEYNVEDGSAKGTNTSIVQQIIQVH